MPLLYEKVKKFLFFYDLFFFLAAAAAAAEGEICFINSSFITLLIMSVK